MLLGYQRMAPAELFAWRPVILSTPVEAIIGSAYGGYYRLCDDAADLALPMMLQAAG